MGNLLAYSGTTTKIRAIRSHLLTEHHFRKLASMSNVTEALLYLKKQSGYKDLFAHADETSLHRSGIEKILTQTTHLDFQKIYRFATIRQRQFLDLYFHRYEISILKTCMRMVFDHRDIKLDLTIFEEFFQKHSDIDLRKISSSDSIENFVENLKGSIYYVPLKRLFGIVHPTLWDYEMAIDLFYFKWFWKNSKKVFKKNYEDYFKESYGIKMDLLNIRWIHRSKKYFQMTNTQIYALLIPINYHLQKEDIRALVEAATADEFAAAVKNTYYGRRYEHYCVDTLDETYYSIRHSVQRKLAKKDPYSVATVISYLSEKEHEVSKLIVTLEGVRYRLSQSEILEYIKQ